MGPADRSGNASAPAAPAAPAVRDGVVSRPGLFALLDGAGRVTEVSAPAGSGKTLLLASWIAEADLAGLAAWVPVQGEERDPQRFWLSVLGALRDTAAGAKLVRPLTAAPDLDGWAVVERLLEDLGALEDRHEPGCRRLEERAARLACCPRFLPTPFLAMGDRCLVGRRERSGQGILRSPVGG